MKKSTRLTHIGRPKIGKGTGVNPSIVRASTLLFDRAEDLYAGGHRTYGRHGSEAHDCLKELFCDLENGAGCTLTPSGLSANAQSILSVVKGGDHVLITDSVYGPVRNFCQTVLKKFGVEVEYYAPTIGADIKSLIRDNTSLILMESPGSLTLDIQDIPAITAIAKHHNITTIVDNTWAAGYVYNPLDLGADMVVHAATKYFSGHSDILCGAIISKTEKLAAQVNRMNIALGNATSPDDIYTILRGARTLAVRFERQEATALALATFLSTHDKVSQVLHPALDSHPQHDLWKRDFTGSACLFSIVLKPCSKQEVIDCLNRLQYFAKGFSFGGYESLIIHCDPQIKRDCSTALDGPLIRIACGLEDYDDLLADLSQSLEALELSA